MSGDQILVDLQEWSQRTATDKGSPLAGIFLEDADARILARELTSSGMLDIRELREGLSITSTSYVGRITLGNLLITIQPKISGMSLVRLLRYAYGLRDLHIVTLAGFESERVGVSRYPHRATDRGGERTSGAGTASPLCSHQ